MAMRSPLLVSMVMKRGPSTVFSRTKTSSRVYSSATFSPATPSSSSQRFLSQGARRLVTPIRPSVGCRRFSSAALNSSRTSPSLLARLLLGSGVVGLSFAVGNQMGRFVEETKPKPVVIEPLDGGRLGGQDNPVVEFVHPYSKTSWVWRYYITAKRLCVLVYEFTPLMFTTFLSKTLYRNNVEWEDKVVEKLQEALNRVGCAFQKFAQWMSMRPDMCSADVIEALSHLRDDVPVHHFEHTRRAIEQSFGQPLEDIFEEFDAEPVASGTVAQVYRAVLKEQYALEGGAREVAVKIRHPRVVEECFVDLDIIFTTLRVLNRAGYPLGVPFRQTEFIDTIQRQMDFHVEAQSLRQFAENFKNELKNGIIDFPRISEEFISSSVLVESWSSGRTISSIFSEVEGKTFEIIDKTKSKFSDSMEKTKKTIARALFDMNMKMFLRDNLVHGDLHAGNLLFDEKTGIVTVIDAGMTTSLDPDSQTPFGDFLRALCAADVEGMTNKLLEFHDGDLADIDVPRFREAMWEITAPFRSENGNGLKDRAENEGSSVMVGDVMGSIILKLPEHGIMLRGDVSSSLVTITLSEGLIMQLDPSFDIVSSAVPYLARYSLGSKVLKALS